MKPLWVLKQKIVLFQKVLEKLSSQRQALLPGQVPPPQQRTINKYLQAVEHRDDHPQTENIVDGPRKFAVEK